MDLSRIKANGPALTPSQQGAFYYARKRRRARENANASEFKVQGDVVGVVMTSLLSVGYFPALGVDMSSMLQVGYFPALGIAMAVVLDAA